MGKSKKKPELTAVDVLKLMRKYEVVSYGKEGWDAAYGKLCEDSGYKRNPPTPQQLYFRHEMHAAMLLFKQIKKTLPELAVDIAAMNEVAKQAKREAHNEPNLD